MEINAPASLATSLGVVVFNPAAPSTDYYWFTDVAGLDGPAYRTPVEDLGLTDGGLVHDGLKSVRHITITGMVVASSVTSRNALCQTLVDNLDSIHALDGTYLWTPTGMATRQLTVRCDVNVDKFTGTGVTTKEFVFGLVAANPTIT